MLNDCHNIQRLVNEDCLTIRNLRKHSQKWLQREITEADNREHRIEGGRKEGRKRIRFMNLFSDHQNRLPGQFICRRDDRLKGRPQRRAPLRTLILAKKNCRLQMQQCSKQGEFILANLLYFIKQVGWFLGQWIGSFQKNKIENCLSDPEPWSLGWAHP